MNRKTFDSLYPPADKIAQSADELFWIVNRVEKVIKPKIILEIGIAWGGSLRYWERIVPKSGLVMGIDIDPKTQEKMSSWWDWKSTDRDLRLINGPSLRPDVGSTVKQMIGDKKIDFLYLDGAHDPLNVFKEFVYYGEIVRYGGAVGFHDINPSMEIQYLFMTIRGCHERCLFGQGTGLWWKERLPHGKLIDNRSLDEGSSTRIKGIWSQLDFEGWG